ncbi:MAG TPA: AI-2E family transporter, partial [Firmicutes bacterium]|nr:AI-2E family transporter [Bacillota bacterium]
MPGENSKSDAGGGKSGGKNQPGGSYHRRHSHPRRKKNLKEQSETSARIPEVPERKETSAHRPIRVMASSEIGSKSILNITNLAIIAVLIGLIIFIVKIASVFGIFLFSFVIAFLLYPSVEWLNSKRIPRVWAILIVYILIGFILFGVGAAIVPAIVAQGNDFMRRLPDFGDTLEEKMLPVLREFWTRLQEKGVTEQDIQKYLSDI